MKPAFFPCLGLVAALLLPLCGNVTVTTTADENDGSLDPGQGAGTSLREAVVHAPAGSVIDFASALSGTTITLAGGQISFGKSLTLDASSLPSGLIVSGNGASRVFDIPSSRTVAMARLKIVHGGDSGDGGGIRNAGTLSLADCELTDNHAGDGGGAIENSGPLTLTACTLAGNTADVGGGAIEHTANTLVLINCTLTGNTADFGGAIDGDGTSSIQLRSCTISGNHATNDGGGLEETTGTLLLENTIVAGNTADDEGHDLKASGINTQNPRNLVSSTAGLGGGFSGIVGDPQLSPLGSHGGFTRTMPPIAGSLAIDAGGSTTLTVDQRGLPRVVGAAVDIGAVEVQAAGGSAELPRLRIRRVGDSVELAWEGEGTLQSAFTLPEPWVDLLGATSPHLVEMTPPRQFFRLLTGPIVEVNELTVLAKTDDSVSLAWPRSLDEFGTGRFALYRDGLEIAQIAGTAYTDDTVSSGGNYTYEVRALGTDGTESVPQTRLWVTARQGTETRMNPIVDRAVLTSSEILRSDILANCFDGAVTDGGNPTNAQIGHAQSAWFQAAFAESRSVSTGRIYHWAGTCNWTLEAANTEDDLEGADPATSYVLVASGQAGSGSWSEGRAACPVSRKIFRFTLARSDGGTGIDVADLQLWTQSVRVFKCRKDFHAVAIRFDPTIRGSDGTYKRVAEEFGDFWPEQELCDEYARQLKRASGGQVCFTYDLEIINDFPPVHDGETPYTAETYLARKAADDYPVFDHRSFVENTIVSATGKSLKEMANDGELDAVWLLNMPGDGFVHEIMNVGQGAYWTNDWGTAPNGIEVRLKDIDVYRQFTINNIPARKDHDKIRGYHHLGHGMEHFLDRISMNYWPKEHSHAVWNTADPDNNRQVAVALDFTDWELFRMTDQINYNWSGSHAAASPGLAQVGNVHYSPNATHNYGVYPLKLDNTAGYKPYAHSGIVYEVPGGDLINPANGDIWLYTDGLAGGGYYEMLAQDFVFEGRLKVLDGVAGSHGGLLFRITEPSGGVAGCGGYYAGLSAIDDRAVLFKYDNGMQLLAAGAVPGGVEADVEYDFKVIASGGLMKVFVGDMGCPVIKVTDNSYLSGGFGITNVGAQTSYLGLAVNTFAVSGAPAWRRYPVLSGETEMVNFGTWENPSSVSRENDFLLWWMEHFPKRQGEHAAMDINTGAVRGGILNSWWPYLVDPNEFDGWPVYDISYDWFPDVTSPGVPTGLQAVAQGRHSVSLSWQEPADDCGVTAYEIYRDGALVQKTTCSQYLDKGQLEGLRAGRTYVYSVKARDGSGNVSAASAEASVNTHPGDPVLLLLGDASRTLVASNLWRDNPEDLYDGIVTENALINALDEPVVITYAFPSAQTAAGAGIYPTLDPGDSYAWEFEAANSSADLESHTGSYVYLGSADDQPTGAWSSIQFSQGSYTHFRFTLERITGDGFVHLAELRILGCPE